MYRIRGILLCTTILVLGCKKLQLTRATEKGAHTFSCIVDGKVFKPDKASLFGGPPLYASAHRNSLSINAFKSGKTGFEGMRVRIYIGNITGAGTYSLNQDQSYASYKLNYQGGAHYETNRSYGGSITVTRYDTLANIYSGKFEFTALDTASGKVIKIKSGRFDVKDQ